ncbi:MAG: ATP-dependent helicase [Gammaproteobacteria bacterium]|jgi:DNA helicase II / ATP-dependent DNA helicase PcrA|nr:ATP-dependent helicase [Gammaproteobacteria bacterium]
MELNEQQRMAATYDGNAKNILVTAGAGCGKTRTIIARAIHLIKSDIDASRILMMTFTNRAAKEMKARLKGEIGPVSEQIQAGTFHSFCLKAMSKAPKSFGIEGLNIIDADDQQSFMTLVRKRHISKHEKKLDKEFPKPAELIKYYSYSRNTCQEPRRYLVDNTDINEEHIDICCRIFIEYQKAKKSKAYLDYDDLLEYFSSALARKPDLKKAVTRLFDEVLVDEMQDTNPLQFRILKHFSDEDVRLFCVGDPAQSIYRFRGAEFRHVYDFQEIFKNSEILRLSLNYRSYQEILDFSNWLLERSPLDYNNALLADRGNGCDLPTMSEFDSNLDEASWIADKILERRETDIQFRDIMILVRSGYDARPIEAELVRRKIPYYFVGGTSLTKLAHVRDVLSLLRIVRNEQDDLAWMRFLKLWPRIGDKTAEKLVNSFYECDGVKPIEILTGSLGTSHPAISAHKQTSSNQSSPKVCISTAVQALTPILEERYDKWDFRNQDLKLLITVSERYKSISEFIDAFTLEPMTGTEIEKLEIDDAVLLITVHSAKGTEAPICFVANAKQGTYPHSRSYGDIESEEEERRVLYVALTRAKNELIVTRSTDHNSGFYVQNKATEGEEYFLSGIPEHLISKEIHGWNSDYSNGLSTLRDIY